MVSECLWLVIEFQVLSIRAVFMKTLRKNTGHPPHPKCCMRMVHFMLSNKENSDQMCLVMLMKTLTAMKELEALQKISCKVNRTSCSTTFLTKEVWNHQSQVGNKVSLSSTCKILTGYHRLAYIVLEINLLRLTIDKSMVFYSQLMSILIAARSPITYWIALWGAIKRRMKIMPLAQWSYTLCVGQSKTERNRRWIMKNMKMSPS